MQKAVNKSVISQARRSFGQQNTLLATLNHDRNHNLRVMSTPTWPVPYYQRAFRHPANLDKLDGNINHVAKPLDAGDALVAKELLKVQGNGYVVEAIEQHYNIDSYLTSFANSQQFSEAYVDDLLDCLGVAHEQNVRLLDEHDLSSALN